MHWQATVQRRYKTRIERNVMSGHMWTVDEPIDVWDVVTPLGVYSWHRSEEKAQAVAKDLQDFYNKFGDSYGQ